jgi:hypothetical protein
MVYFFARKYWVMAKPIPVATPMRLPIQLVPFPGSVIMAINPARMISRGKISLVSDIYGDFR